MNTIKGTMQSKNENIILKKYLPTAKLWSRNKTENARWRQKNSGGNMNFRVITARQLHEINKVT